MKKETFEKVLLAALLLGGLVYSYVTYLLGPELNTLESLNNELQMKSTHYDQLLGYQGNLKGLEEEIKSLQVQNAELAAQIPSIIDKPQRMVYIYSVAKSAQVEPVSLTFEPSKNSGDVQSMVMSFSCLGKINDVLTFAKKIQFEGTQRMGIQSITLVNQNGKVKADIKLVAYASNLKVQEPSAEPTISSGKSLTSIEQMFRP